jgi:hypothetical protein
MTRICFLHVGANKTGSTSIQQSQFFDLRDPGFQYVGGGRPNGSFAISTVFNPSPENQLFFNRAGAAGRFEDYRRRCARQLDRGWTRAIRQGRHAVVSAEACWQSSRQGLLNLRDHLMGMGFEVRVLAYVRPWLPWAGSVFQQMVKSGRGSLVVGLGDDGAIFAVRERLKDLFAVFGRANVAVHRFNPDDFPDRCVVRHFCGQIGMPVPTNRTWRLNESLSLPATQLLYAFHRCSPLGGEGRLPRPPGLQRLLLRLRGLRGPAFRLHSSFLSEWLVERRRDDQWLTANVGFSLADIPPPDDEHSVETEADLLRFAPETREWIAERVGQPVVRLPDGEAAAGAIADQVDLLRRKGRSPRERVVELRDGIRNAWIRRHDAC